MREDLLGNMMRDVLTGLETQRPRLVHSQRIECPYPAGSRIGVFDELARHLARRNLRQTFRIINGGRE